MTVFAVICMYAWFGGVMCKLWECGCVVCCGVCGSCVVSVGWMILCELARLSAAASLDTSLIIAGHLYRALIQTPRKIASLYSLDVQCGQ